LTFYLLIDGTTFGWPKQNWPLASLTTALAVAEAVESFVPRCDARIKWPNDIYVQGRKLSGILIETAGRRPSVLVIGIGINVNNSLESAPAAIRDKATSLRDLTSRTFDRTEVLISVLRRLADRLPTVAADDGNVAEAMRARCFLQGRTVQLNTGTEQITGICQGIDERGALLLLTEAGLERCFGGAVTRIL
jgi:BirA family biotin operon repressor/biotin-[acetyl-CoA-carboxylase] ligase